MNYELKIQTIKIIERKMTVVFSGIADLKSDVAKPKVILHFFSGDDDRRIPLVVREYKNTDGRCFFAGSCSYNLNYIFFDDIKKNDKLKVYANVMFEDYYEEKAPVSLKPQILKYERSAYDVTAEENYLLISRNKDKVYDDRKKNTPPVVIHSILWGLATLVCLPAIVLNGFLAEARLVPFVNKRSASMPTKKGRIMAQITAYIKKISALNFGRMNVQMDILKVMMFFGRLRGVRRKSLGFVSLRADEMSGNMKCVYDYLKGGDVKYYCFCSGKDFRNMSIRELARIAKVCSSSRVILVDEYTPFIGDIRLRKGSRVIQLWHACGAFKTFGYSRIGKIGGPNQKSFIHRTYDYATVSSTSVRRWYAEGFGIPTDRVTATGVPRTDIFFDENHKEKTVQNLEAEFPIIKGKKVILFAPTFRSSGRLLADYPVKKFDVKEFMENIPDDYVLVIKHHPFVTRKHPVPKKYQDRVIDLTNGVDINELLFAVDIVITDYSSLIYEASLLKTPMMFYAFDLREYIADRDFYFNYETYVPGPICFTQKEMTDRIAAGDLDYEAVEKFAEENFDIRDGNATKRVCELIESAMKR